MLGPDLYGFLLQHLVAGGDVLDAVQKKLHQASDIIEKAKASRREETQGRARASSR